MAHRGGRGGKTSSFTQEQLQALGVGKDTPVTLAPPPLFPPLLSKPIPLESNADREYKILWKEDFITFLKDSPYFLKRKDADVTSERYSDTLVNVIENETKGKAKSDINYSCMPAELRPNYKRSKSHLTGSGGSSKKSKQNLNIVEKLSKLEENEKFETEDEVVKEKKKSADDDEENEENEEVDENVDEEMDDENDYGNSYFDNGEAFNEEDDNLDDEPVY